jgi:hypothetical protein
MKNKFTHFRLCAAYFKEVAMKKWHVGLCYSGYVWQEVEASSAEEARDKAVEIAGNGCHGPVITDWERWGEADQIIEAE